MADTLVSRVRARFRPRSGTAVLQLLAGALVTLAFAAPAMWNGFPLLFFDTGGYLAAAIEGTPSDGRSAIYGAFLALGREWNFWPAVVIQSAIMAWLLTLVLRAQGLGGRPGLTALIGLALAALTSLRWYTAQLMPDILAPMAVIAVYLLAFRIERLTWVERLALGCVTAFAMASHMATFGLIAGLCATLVVWRVLSRRWPTKRPTLRGPVIATVAGLALALTSNLVLIGQFTFTPGGSNFLFGRLLEAGIVSKYLADNCPDHMLRLCPYRHDLPDRGDDWLWDGETSPLYKLGGWDGFEDEASAIVSDSLLDYPLEHARAALSGMLAQLIMVKTGDGLLPWTWHAQWMIGRVAPDSSEAMRAARQQQTELDFATINTIQVPVALLATGILPFVILMTWRRTGSSRPTEFATFILVALLGNAFICGALSNPHDRYQSRLVPLATLALMLAAPGRQNAKIGIATSRSRESEA